MKTIYIRKILHYLQLILCNQIPIRYLTRKYPHPIGIVIGSESEIHDSAVIYQNVTIGRASLHNSNGYPIIKKNCIIYPGAVVAGNIIVNDNSIISANSIVTKSTPGNCTVFGYNEVKSGLTHE